MKHPAKWTAPVPFWNDASSPENDMLRPRILRFATDSFMEDLFGLLERDPRGLPALEAEAETWRGPSRRSDAVLVVEPSTESGPLKRLHRKLLARSLAPRIDKPDPDALKLYQPAHQRHYLASAMLVCERPGLPDRRVDRSLNQSVSMLVRRLVPPAQGAPFDANGRMVDGWTEAAFVQGPQPRWVRIAAVDSARIAAGEERLPVFPATYKELDDRCRRLFLGTIPVGRREVYQNTPVEEEAVSGGGSKEPSMDRLGGLLDKLVLGPWQVLAESCFDAMGNVPEHLISRGSSDAIPMAIDSNSKPDAATLAGFRADKQIASWHILAQLHGFLLDYGTESVKSALGSRDATAAALSPLRETIRWSGYDASRSIANHFAKDLAVAIVEIGRAHNLSRLSAPKPEVEHQLVFPRHDTAITVAMPVDKWPDFLFLLADPYLGGYPGASGRNCIAPKLEALRESLLEMCDPALAPSGSTAIRIPSSTRDAWYSIRFVLEHPECTHHDEIMGPPTVPFQLAGYFDANAPVRPVRIGLPIDPTPEGLRKADRNTVFMLSDTMCNQISRMKGIGFVDLVLSVLPWPFHKGLPKPPAGDCKKGDELGMMLVVSIPIITLCALIILIIMVTLLDIVFKWLPFFMFWIPVKKDSKGNVSA